MKKAVAPVWLPVRGSAKLIMVKPIWKPSSSPPDWMPMNRKLTAMLNTRPSTTSPSIMSTTSNGCCGMIAPETEICGQTPRVKMTEMAALTLMGILLVEKMGNMNMTILTRMMVSIRLSTVAGS